MNATDDLAEARSLASPAPSPHDPAPLGADLPDDEWMPRLSLPEGAARDEAVRQLHTLLLRAAHHRISQIPDAARLGAVRRDEIAHSAADVATVSVLGRLGSFEGRSRFTTWAYKFGILHAGAEVQRAIWKDRDIPLDDIHEPTQPAADSPEARAEGTALAQAVRAGMLEALTEHQRRIAIALLIDEVPIDVLAERLGGTRGALYKTLHDVRKRLRSHLTAGGFLPTTT